MLPMFEVCVVCLPGNLIRGFVCRPGKHADFVVLHGDLEGLKAPGNLPSVAQTYIDGQCIYGCQ